MNGSTPSAAERPVLICEKTGEWAALLRWHQGECPLPLRELRSLIDARAALAADPAPILVMEVTSANAEGILRLTLEAQQQWPAARIIVLLTPPVRRLASLYWEAGVAVVVDSPRRMELVVHSLRRLLARRSVPELPLRERIWSRLPWEPR